MENYKKIAIYIVFIFITFCIVGNTIIYVAPNSEKNSLDFSNIEDKAKVYTQEKSSIDNRIKEKLNMYFTSFRKGDCKEFFYLLTDECKKRYNNSLSDFTNVITSKYFAEKTNYMMDYLGYNSDNNCYIFEIYIFRNPYLTDEELKMEVYKERYIYIKVYQNENEEFKYDFDYENHA